MATAFDVWLAEMFGRESLSVDRLVDADKACEDGGCGSMSGDPAAPAPGSMGTSAAYGLVGRVAECALS